MIWWGPISTVIMPRSKTPAAPNTTKKKEVNEMRIQLNNIS